MNKLPPLCNNQNFLAGLEDEHENNVEILLGSSETRIKPYCNNLTCPAVGGLDNGTLPSLESLYLLGDSGPKLAVRAQTNNIGNCHENVKQPLPDNF